MNKFLKVVVFLFVLASFQAVADSNNDLQSFVNSLKTFSADFEQTQPEEEFFQTNEAFGSFKLQRPGQMLWVYYKPDPQDIMVDGANIWVFDRDLDQVTVRDILSVKRDFPLSWLLFDEPIEKRYRIIYSHHVTGMSWFNLRPREATFFESLDIGMKDGVMVEVHMYQSPTNVTKVKFKNIVINEKMSDASFRFNVPAGVDLIGQPLAVP